MLQASPVYLLYHETNYVVAVKSGRVTKSKTSARPKRQPKVRSDDSDNTMGSDDDGINYSV